MIFLAFLYVAVMGIAVGSHDHYAATHTAPPVHVTVAHSSRSAS